MKQYAFFFLLVFSIVLVGCNTKTTNKNATKYDGEKINQTVHEVQQQDFIYRLVSEKKVYIGTDTVQLFAELEYVGDEEEVTISHGGSPFYFTITEKTQDYLIGYTMTDPLLLTTLKKGHPLREEYTKSGGYSDQDDAEYINFLKDFWENGFPTGYYVVEGYADFSVETGDAEQTNYKISGVVDFEVKR